MLNKIISVILLIASVGLFFYLLINMIRINYNFEKDIFCYWELADRSSTIKAKCDYIDKFVKAIEANKFSDYDAIWMKTPENSFQYNFEALKTLRDRLYQIKDMKENSFEYQTAIQQITSQEQGEACSMLNVIDGCYIKEKSIINWNWIMFIVILFDLLSIMYFSIGVHVEFTKYSRRIK